MLARSLQALHAANASCASAAAINFEQAHFVEKFKIRPARGNELECNDAKHPALQEGSKLKTVLAALAELVGKDDEQTIRDIGEESDALVGEIAELKAQLAEVTSATYVVSRVEDEISSQRCERMEEERRLKSAEQETGKLREELKVLNSKLSVFSEKKRKRELADEGGGSEADKEQAEIARMEKEIIQQDMALADLEAAVQTERVKIEQANTQKQMEESEIRLIKRALAAKRAQAEARLEISAEYKQLIADIEEAKVAATKREEEMRQANENLLELQSGFEKLIEGMAAKGHAPASTLKILMQSSQPVPMQSLKEQLAAHLSTVGASQKGYEGQQVLEAVYSLVSDSLIQIDRTSAQQLVRACL